MNRCKYCLHTDLRPARDYIGARKITTDTHQCLNCFRTCRPLVIRDDPECPICGEDVLSTRPIVLDVCIQCHTAICWPCATQINKRKCTICKGPTRAGYYIDMSPLNDMSGDLRALLLDAASSAIASGRKVTGPLMIEYTKWLTLAKLAQDPLAIYCPPQAIHDLWAAHVSCTRNYATVCEIICGPHGMIHYHPSKPNEAALSLTIERIRRIEPYTIHTANIWDCPMQSPAFNLEPTGRFYIKSLSQAIYVAPYHPEYTLQDVLIKMGFSIYSSRLIYAGRRLFLERTLADYNIGADTMIQRVDNLRGD